MPSPTVTYGMACGDGEDRLVSEFFPGSQAFPNGHQDLYTYTGLRMRLTKQDPAGTHSYLADGVSPASDVLTDGATAFTPGISETNGNGAGVFDSHFYLADAQGNSRGQLDGGPSPSGQAGTGQAVSDAYTFDAFGNGVSHAGGSATAYGWGEESGYQTDQDGGLRLLGHRYYDSRTGRFISQDPAGDGDNWYGYCGNDPMDGTDPTGLNRQQDDEGWEWDMEGVGSDPFIGDVGMGDDGTRTIFTEGSKITGTGGGGDITGPSDANDLGIGGVFDQAFTLGLVSASGRDWDSHPTKARWEAAGAAALVVATAISAARGAAAGAKALLEDGCFTAGTPVQMENGTEPIEAIPAGDLVATRDPQTGQDEYRQVTRTFIHQVRETVTAQFADAGTGQVVETVTATPEHPFFVAGRGFAALGSLGVGTLVVTRAGPSLVLKSLVRQSEPQGVTVYNLEVEGDHTYFVGTTGGGLWVHNDCWSIARGFRRSFGGEVWKLSPKLGRFIDRAVEPASGTADEFGGIESWYEHAVHVKDGMVRDPMMTGSNEALPMEQWQRLWNHFGDHNFGPSR